MKINLENLKVVLTFFLARRRNTPWRKDRGRRDRACPIGVNLPIGFDLFPDVAPLDIAPKRSNDASASSHLFCGGWSIIDVEQRWKVSTISIFSSRLFSSRPLALIARVSTSVR